MLADFVIFFIETPSILHTIHLVPKIQVGARNRTSTENNFADTEVEELIAMLRETENLEEQGDILQYLVDTQGLDYNTGTSYHHTDVVVEIVVDQHGAQFSIQFVFHRIGGIDM